MKHLLIFTLSPLGAKMAVKEQHNSVTVGGDEHIGVILEAVGVPKFLEGFVLLNYGCRGKIGAGGAPLV